VDVWFTADTHFQHANIIEYCQRPFKDVKLMDEVLRASWNEVVAAGDVVYHLGDFAFARNAEYVRRLVRGLSGQIHLIFGNHDSKLIRKLDCFAWSGYYKTIEVTNQRLILFHYAMRVWQGSHHGSWQLYCLFYGNLPEPASLASMDVGVDAAYRLFGSFRPFHFDEIKGILTSRKHVQEDMHSQVRP
jgi:calcineurin-like phosphoesterase family protein